MTRLKSTISILIIFAGVVFVYNGIMSTTVLVEGLSWILTALFLLGVAIFIKLEQNLDQLKVNADILAAAIAASKRP